MPGIYVYQRERKRKDGTKYTEKKYTARIVFGRKKEFLRSTRCTSEREAEIAAKKIARQIETEELPRLGLHRLTISEMFGRWWMEYGHEMRTADTAQMRVKHLLSFFGETLPIEEISNSHINDYVQHRKKDGKAPATINREIDILKGALSKAKRRWEESVQDIFWEDYRQKEPKEREVYITPEELRAIIMRLPEHIKLMVAWSVYTGCRLNETETLLKDNMHFDLRLCQIFAKGGDMRTVALSDHALAVAMKAFEQSNTNFVFNKRNRRKHWEKAKSEAGRPDLRWHDLRHITGTWLNQYANSSMKKISKAMGHADLSSTNRYVHVAPVEVIKELNKLPQIY